MNRHTILMFIVGLLCDMSSVHAEDYIYKNPVGDEFPILAWYSILPDEEQTPARYQELRDAGFNLSFSLFSSKKQVKKALDLCQEKGIKLIAMCNELNSDTESTVKELMNHEALAGWFIGDEPSRDMYPQLGKLVREIRRWDKEHVIYGNLFPIMISPNSEDYADYVRRYAREVNAGLISYDMYPITQGGDVVSLHPRYYDNVETIRRVSREVRQPFWGFALSTAHSSYPVPTLQHLRLQAFVNLAYGAQCIQYFTYWTPKGTVWDFHHAPIDEYGNRTDVYYRIQELNAEIQNLKDVFLGSTVKSVGYLYGNVPSGCSTYVGRPKQMIRIKMLKGSGLLMSHIVRDTKHFFFCMNHEVNSTKEVLFTTTPEVKRILPSGETVEKEETQTEMLQPGDYVIFYWDDEETGVLSASSPMSFGAVVENGSIRIRGGVEAYVYTLNGEYVGHTSSAIPVKPGIYVVRCQGRTIKVKL